MRKMLILLSLLLAASVYPQQTNRNRISYRTFDWQKIEDKQENFLIYFPKEMEDLGYFVAREVRKMYSIYRKDVFNTDYPIILNDTTDSWFRSVLISIGLADTALVARNSEGSAIFQRINWQPKEIVIVLFPNMQDYGQQRIIDVFLPPGILGLTEGLTYRITHPYGGNIHDLTLVTAHELAHAWMFNFMADWRNLAWKTGLRPLGENKTEMKLWFSEGFAELLADIYLEKMGTGEDYRRAKVNEFNMKSVVEDEIPPLSGPFEMDGWGNYSFGYHFLKFVAKEYSLKHFSEFMKLIAEGNKKFEEAWISVFGESLDQTELRWQKTIKFNYQGKSILAAADNLEKKHLLLPFSLAGPIGYDPKSGRIAAYRRDEKWGLQTVAISTDSLQALQDLRKKLSNQQLNLFELHNRVFEEKTKDSLGRLRDKEVDSLERENQAIENSCKRLEKKVVVEVDHQFKDKALFYRLDNPPTVLGNRVALSVSEDGQDNLNVFEIDLSGKEGKATRIIQERFENIFWVNDLSFVNADKVLFVGMDRTGEKNIYSFSISEKILEKITDTPGEKFSPKRTGETTFFIEADSLDKRGLWAKDKENLFRVRFGERGFIDNLVVSDSLVVIRVLGSDGLPEILIWPYKDSVAYRYRHGSVISTEEGKRNVAYPLPHHLLGLVHNEELVLADSETRGRGSYNIAYVTLDFNRLEKRAVIKSLSKTVQRPVSPAIRQDTTFRLSKADKALRFPTLFQDNFYGNGYRFGIANATGEYALSGSLDASYDSYFGFMHFVELDYYDFSSRLQNATSLSTARYYRYRNYFYINHAADENQGLILDQFLKAKRAYLWPFDLENSVSLGLGLGYLRREYISFLTEETKILKTPFLELSSQFTSDGTFIDYLRSSRHGHFFKMRGEFSSDTDGSLFDGSFVTDFRYYLRPWQASPYLASRLFYAKTFGRDASWFVFPDINREPGFNRFNYDRGFGNEVFAYQTEFRLPLVRWMMFDYKFWENPVPSFLVSVNAFAFLYGGDIHWTDEPIHFAHRGGYGLKFGLGFVPFYLRFERYIYLNRQKSEREMALFPKLFNGEWQNAWVIEVEF